MCPSNVGIVMVLSQGGGGGGMNRTESRDRAGAVVRVQQHSDGVCMSTAQPNRQDACVYTRNVSLWVPGDPQHISRGPK